MSTWQCLTLVDRIVPSGYSGRHRLRLDKILNCLVDEDARSHL